MDFFKNHRFFLVVEALSLVMSYGVVYAQQAIPSSIQLEERVVSVPSQVHSRFATPVSYSQPKGTQYRLVSDSVLEGTSMLSESVEVIPTPTPNTGIPRYTPDGSVTQMVTDTESELIADAYTGMDVPSEGLFLSDFCAPYCGPTCDRICGTGCWFVEGYVDQGFSVNSNSSSYGEPTAVNDREGYQLNQVYLSVGRKVCRGRQWSFGGQLDIMYGTDYYYMTSTGLETTTNNYPHWNGMNPETSEYRAGRNMYGMALPQAYLEANLPIFLGVDVKVGHFHSVMGFESNQANQNFFYSRSYSSVYGMPTSMTGVMTDWKVAESWSVIAGAVNEWNSFDTPEDNCSYVLGATYENACGNFALSAIVMSGKQSVASFQGYDYRNDGAKSTVLDVIAKFRCTERLIYVAEFNYGTSDSEVYDITASETFNGRNWYGFSNYLFYCMNEKMTLGARFEWFHDKENTVLSGGYDTTFAKMGVNYFSWSFGANWDPMPWLTVRPELRWDYSDMEFDVDGQKYYAYDRNSANYQFTVGCDAIIRF